MRDQQTTKSQSQSSGQSATTSQAPQSEPLSPNSWMPSVDSAHAAYGGGLDFLSEAAGDLFGDQLSFGNAESSDQMRGYPGAAHSDVESKETWFDWGGLVAEHEHTVDAAQEDFRGPGADGREGRPNGFSKQSSETRAGYDLLAGEASASRGVSSEGKGLDGSEYEKASEGSASIGFDEGIQVGAAVKHTNERTDADGTQHGASFEGVANGGLVVTEDEWGVQGSGSAYTSHATEDTSHGGGVSGSVTNKGASGALKVGQKAGDETGLTGHMLLDGSFSTDIVGDEGDRRYTETMGLGLGGEGEFASGDGAWGWLAEAGASAWEAVGASIGVSAYAKGDAELSYSRKLTEQDESDIGNHGEAHWRAVEAMAHQDRSGAMSVLGGPGASDMAANLEDGESWSLQTQLEGELGGTTGVEGVGLSTSAGKTWQRTFTVEKTRDEAGNDAVTLTIAFTEVDTSSWGATLEAWGISNAFEQASEDTAGQSLTVTIATDDADYDRVYAWFEEANDVREIDLLARQDAVVSRMEGRSWSQGDKDTESFESGPVGVTKTGEHESTVTLDGDGELTASGSAGNRTELGVGDVPLGADVTRGRLNARNGGIAIGTERETSALSIESILEGLTGLTGLTMFDVVQDGPGGAVADSLAEVEKQLQAEVEYETSDVDALVDRAQDAKLWSWCAAGFPNDRAAWGGLRAALLAPKPVREWFEANPDDAMMIARGQAILAFVAAAKNATGILEKARFEWGHTPDGELDTREGDGAQALGTNVDFSGLSEEDAARETARWHETTLAAPEMLELWERGERELRIEDDEHARMRQFLDNVHHLDTQLHEHPPDSPVAAADMRLRIGEWLIVAQSIEATFGTSEAPSMNAQLQLVHGQLFDLVHILDDAIAAFDGVDPERDGQQGYLGSEWLPQYQAMLEVEQRWWTAHSMATGFYRAGKIDESQHVVSAGEVTELPADPDWQRIHEIKSWFRGS